MSSILQTLRASRAFATNSCTKRACVLALLLTVGLLTPSVAQAQPPNDQCDFSTFVSGSSVTIAGTTNGASGVDESNCGTSDVNDVWFSWSAPCSGPVVFSLCTGTTLADTTLTVFEGGCPAFGGIQVGCNDNFCGQQSELTVQATSFFAYAIRVAGVNATTGDFTLTINCPPTGACCVAPGEFGCQESSTADCAAVGGNYLGDNTTCETDTCSTSACCNPDTSCTTIMYDQFGVPIGESCNPPSLDLGAGTDCETTACPIFGACCVGAQACVLQTQEDCEAINGNLYVGDGTDCSTNPCATGACCDPSTMPLCINLDPFSCQLPATYLGDGSDCATSGCPGFGACCIGGGVCQILAAPDCANANGNYLGDQTSCALEPCATGACCDLLNGGCNDLSGADCALDPNGFYQGDGSNCIGAPCPGAGDDCGAAVIVQSGIVFMGDSTDATGTNESSCAGTGDTNDIWHRWLADCTGPVVVDTNGSAFDTSLAVFDGCGGIEIECDDDGGDGLQSLLTFDAVEGIEYRIRVAGFGGATGIYNLQITCPPEGACCSGNGMCQVISPEGCALIGGFFAGVDVACTPTLCSTGGCCFSDGTCMDGMDQTACEGDGGFYNGDGTSCPQGGVGPGTFSVVLDDTFGDGWNGSTLNIFVNGVSATGGPIQFFGGDGDPAGFQLIVEFDVPAANSIITTSYTTGAFEAENTWEIRDQFGTPICSDGPNPDPTPLRLCVGSGVGCPPTGACCTGPMGGPFVCTVDFEDACVAGGGTFLGAGTNCDDAPNGGDRCDCNGNGEVDSNDLAFGNPGPPVNASSLDTPIPIPDSPAPAISSTITIPPTAGVVGDVNVTLDIPHTWMSDLDVTLTHDGVSVLIAAFCPESDGYNCTFDDDGLPVVCNGDGFQVTGIVQPLNPLAGFNGTAVGGDWTLSVEDQVGADTGTLNLWSIDIVPSDEPVGTDCNGNTILDECEVPDPTTIGACCQLDGLCTIQTQVDCEANNGFYNGGCVTCEEVECAPTGACCLSPVEGPITCEIRFLDTCEAEGGVYLGNFTDCTPLPGTDDRCDCNDNGEVDGTEIAGGTFQSTDTPIDLPDLINTTSLINVSAAGNVTDVNVALVGTHTFVADLEFTLEHNGVSVDIFSDNCGGDDDFDVLLDDDGGPLNCDGTGPVMGTFIPDNPLSAFNGISAAGTWTLTINDDAGGDTGSFTSWTLILTTDGEGGSDCDGNGVLDECQTPDPSQTGACCLTNGSCIDTSPADCDMQGGLFQGGCTTCFEVQCAPVGACCTGPAPFTCSITFRDLCETGGGTYLGNGTDCTPLPPTTDRCDCNDNDIVDLDEIAGGTFGSTDTPIAIPDGPGGTIMSVLNAGAGGFVSDVNVSIQITHTFIADMEITLEHDGVSVDLWFDNCGGDNNMDVLLDDSAAPPPADCPEPVVGTFAPDNPLAAFNGTSAGGTWTLRVVDDAGIDTGTLDSWSLIITTTGGGGGSDCNANGILDECEAVDPSLTGGCCIGSSCTIELETDCTTNGGNFLGGCSDCSQTCPGVEACCFSDGSCQDILFFDCVAMGGVSQGALTTCGTIICPPPPAENDECDANIVEVFDGSTPVSLETATSGGLPACGDFPFGTDTISNDLWFEYTATCTGTLFIDTCGTADDTRLAVYDVDCTAILGGAFPIECNDDHGNATEADTGNTCPTPGTFQASLSIPGAVAGNTYIIRVGSFSAVTPAPLGIFNLNIGCFAAGGPESCCFADGTCQDLVPGDCATAGGTAQGFGTQCATTVCPPPPVGNDECDANIVEVFDGSTPVSLETATSGGLTACGDFPVGNQEINNDLWFEYTATCTGTLFVDTCGTASDTRLAVYDVDCAAILGGTLPVECNDDHGSAAEGDTGNTCPNTLSASLSVPGVVSGQTYIIRVGSFLTTPDPIADFNLNIGCFAAGGPEACCFADGTCQDLVPGDCATAGGAAQGFGSQCATTNCPQPPPTNDNCDAGIVEIFNGTTPIDVTAVTNSTLASCGDFPVDNGSGFNTVENDLFFEYTATCTGTLFVDTCGTTDDTRLAIYDVDCTAINGGALPVECNDDHGNAAEADTGNTCVETLAASLSIPVVQGQTYIIRVGTFDDANPPAGDGLFNLNVDCVGETMGCDLLGDLNDDTLVDGQDIQGFVDCVLGGGSNCECADYDGLNGADLEDVGPFVADLLGITFVPCSCRGDANGDGVVDGEDLDDFISCLVLGTGANCGCADMDGIGGVNDDDIDLFAEAVLNGPGCAPAP